MSLLLYLLEPASIAFPSELPESIGVGRAKAVAANNLWEAAFDYLADPTNGDVVGVALPIRKQHWDNVQSMLRGLDRRIIRLNDLSSDHDRKMYGIDPNEAHVLEIIWTDKTPRAYVAAIATSDQWYVFDQAGDTKVAAFGIVGWPKLLEYVGLGPPTSYSIPGHP